MVIGGIRQQPLAVGQSGAGVADAELGRRQQVSGRRIIRQEPQRPLGETDRGRQIELERREACADEQHRRSLRAPSRGSQTRVGPAWIPGALQDGRLGCPERVVAGEAL